MRKGSITSLLLGGGTVAAVAAILFWPRDAWASNVNVKPDYPPEPSSGKTGFRGIDAIMPQLQSASRSTGIPLGLFVGWIAAESNGNIKETTSLNEKGYFQLMPEESKSLGLDHDRLGTDPQYSIDGGVQLIQKRYVPFAQGLGIFPNGSADFFRLVKLGHTMGVGAAKKVVDAAKAAGAVSSWDVLDHYAMDNSSALYKQTGHSPKKWFPLVDKVYSIGAPYGFGGGTAVAGLGSGGALTPVVEGYTSEDADALARMLASELPGASPSERRAAAWATRNRATEEGMSVRDVLCPTGGYGPQDDERPFASTRSPAGADEKAVADAVLGAAVEADPTGGATDFWCPKKQNERWALGKLYRLAKERGDAVGAFAAYGGYTKSAADVRKDLAERGMRVRRVGSIELLKKA